MIVTRRRKRRSHPGRVIVPLLIVAVVGFLLGFPPSRNAIATGPLAPLWNAGTSVAGTVTRPLSFAGQQETITQRNREIRDLNARLEAERTARQDAEARAEQLQAQLTSLANQPVPTPMPAARRPAAATGVVSLTVEADAKRVAATWAAMEPERAAALVQRLPEAQAGRVLAQMDAQSAGAIMDALPSAAAARITKAQAQVR